MEDRKSTLRNRNKKVKYDEDSDSSTESPFYRNKRKLKRLSSTSSSVTHNVRGRQSEPSVSSAGSLRIQRKCAVKNPKLRYNGKSTQIASSSSTSSYNSSRNEGLLPHSPLAESHIEGFKRNIQLEHNNNVPSEVLTNQPVLKIEKLHPPIQEENDQWTDTSDDDVVNLEKSPLMVTTPSNMNAYHQQLQNRGSAGSSVSREEMRVVLKHTYPMFKSLMTAPRRTSSYEDLSKICDILTKYL